MSDDTSLSFMNDFYQTFNPQKSCPKQSVAFMPTPRLLSVFNKIYKNSIDAGPWIYHFFFTMTQEHPVGQGFLIIEGSWSHSDTPSTPLGEWSARRRDPYLTTHNTRNRQTFMPSVGFEPPIPKSERLQNHALDRAAIGTGKIIP
jgi:hypothetical protein